MTDGHRRAGENTPHPRRGTASGLNYGTDDTLRERLAPRQDNLPPKVPFSAIVSRDDTERRWRMLGNHLEWMEVLADWQTLDRAETYQGNIENFLGTLKMPLGLAGPLRVNGAWAQGDYYLPLATTEAALVASYSRGAQVISESGGCSALLLEEGVSRAPAFAFHTLAECGAFVGWAASQLGVFHEVAERTTRYGRLADMSFSVEGNHVYLRFEYLTGDAAGQNMVTIATEAICAYIEENSPVRPRYYFVEGNFSGDKKASAQSFLSVRGKKVTAEVTVPRGIVERRLHSTPERMADYFRMGALGGVLSGTIGVQGHFANGLAALYIACGQDAACVAESAVGVTRFETTPGGDLYGAVTLPNVIVGTVGGGTRLPSQRACLELLGLYGAGHAGAFAEVIGGLCLAGELSLTAALCSGEFTRAHQSLARSTPALAAAAESPGRKQDHG